MYNTLMTGLKVGLQAGVVWGLAAYGYSAAAGEVYYIHGFLPEIFIFAFGGALFGLVTGGLFAWARVKIPVKNPLLAGATVSVGLWLVLRAGGALFKLVSPEKYLTGMAEDVRGFIMSVVLGLLVGAFWSLGERRTRRE